MPVHSCVRVLFLLTALAAFQTHAEVPQASPAKIAQDQAALDAGDLDKNCGDGDAEACSRIGHYHLLGAYGRTEDASMAVPFLQRACDIGPPKGCSSLADAYRRGKGVPVDAPRALALHSKACDGGSYTGCYGLLSMQSEGLAAAADQESNLRLAEKICRPDQSSWVCADARELIKKIQVSPAVYRAQQCEAGKAYECLIIANSHAAGDGVPVDMARAAVAYGKACDFGLAVACNTLGEYYAHGSGVTQDFVRAAQLFQRGCTETSVEGCANLGAMYFNGTGVPQDLNRAAVLNQKACDGGNVRGCDFMERAGVAILGTPEQRRAEADALGKETKARSAEALQRAYEVNIGGLADHFELEANTRADADAVLARIASQSAAPSVPTVMPSEEEEAAGGAAGISPVAGYGVFSPTAGPVPNLAPRDGLSSCPMVPRKQSGTSGFHNTREAAEAQAKAYVRCGEGGIASMDAPTCNQHMNTQVTMSGGKTSSTSTPSWSCGVSAVCTIGTPQCADDRPKGSSGQ